MHHAFGFASAATGVQNKQRILGIHGFGGCRQRLGYVYRSDAV
jgi:hypothetical protein